MGLKQINIKNLFFNRTKQDIFSKNKQIVKKIDLVLKDLSKNYFPIISHFLQIPKKEINFYFAKKLFHGSASKKSFFFKISCWSIVPFIFIFFFYIFFIFIKKNKKKTNKISYFTIFSDINSL